MADNKLRPGTLIDDRFLLGKRLGSGSTGVVWRALDQESGQDVALKILHPKMSHDAMLVAQLAREADVLQQLDHPHIATSFAFQPDGPFVYLAMEFIDGRPLHEVIGAHTRDKRYFEHREVMNILSQLADAVGHAHAKYIVHRDLKPQNVIVIGDGPDATVKVLDFGIARLLEGSIFDATTLGRQLGSLFYMSPEQTRGEPADARSDVFALGAILFELITLRRAWAWDEQGMPVPAFERPVPAGEANALAAVFTRLTSGPRPRVSDARLEMPPSFDAVITRALAVKREDRYASVQEFAKEALGALERITGSVEAATVLASAVGEVPWSAEGHGHGVANVAAAQSGEYAETALLAAADHAVLGTTTVVDSEDEAIETDDQLSQNELIDTMEGSIEETAAEASITAPPVPPEHSGRSKRDYPETVEFVGPSDEAGRRSGGAQKSDPRSAEARSPRTRTRPVGEQERPPQAVEVSAPTPNLPRFDDVPPPVTALSATRETPQAQEEGIRLLPIVAVAIVSMLAAILVGLVIFDPEPAVESVEIPPEATRPHATLWQQLATVEQRPKDKVAMQALSDGIVKAAGVIEDDETSETIVACAKGNALLANPKGMRNCLERLTKATQ